jgi:hypothetical protein
MRRIHCKTDRQEHKKKNMNDSKLYCIRFPFVGRNIVMSVVAVCDGNFVVRDGWDVHVTAFVIGTNRTVVIPALAAKWIDQNCIHLGYYS